jgi:hypothetical protein
VKQDRAAFTLVELVIASPTNAASALRIESACVLPGGFQVLGFTAVSNHSYSILFRDDQLTGSWQKLSDILPPPTTQSAWITNKPGSNSAR